MKLQDFLIGIGLFALFTVIIFGAINNNGGDCTGIYCKNYLNYTHDSNTQKRIQNISTVGETTNDNFNEISDSMNEFTTNGTTTETKDESTLVGDALKVLVNLPKSYKPVVNVLRELGTQFKIPSQFLSWVISSVVIIIIIMIITSLLKNKLQS